MRSLVNRNVLIGYVVAVLLSVLFALFPGAAHAAGLDQAGTVMNMLKANLMTLIPVVATVALMIVALLYSMRMMHKDAFVHWFIGILIVGSASEITAMIIG